MRNGVCPLCHGNRTEACQQFEVHDLIALYSEPLRLEVARLVDPTTTVQLMVCVECGLMYFDPATAGSAEYYRLLQAIPHYYRKEKAEFAHARRWINPGERVLEVGCADGNFGATLDNVDYVGLEINPSAIDTARAAGLDVRAELVEHHARTHPASYDIVCAFQVLEHVTDVSGFVEASIASLRPGGRLILSVPNAESFIGLVPGNALNLPPHHVTWWTRRAFDWMARRYGLRVRAIDVETLAPIHHQLYATTAWARHLVGDLPLIDRGLRFRLLWRLSGVLASTLRPVFSDDRLLPPGHALTATLELPASVVAVHDRPAAQEA